jgi:glycosyltransferase involved in cell wall biosynthesis
LRDLLRAPSPKRSSKKTIGKVDVVVLTKNSQEQLERCLEAVYNNVPVNRLIVVDGYSTDKTLEIVKKFDKKHHNVLLIQDRSGRGKARQIGIEKIETEWFMFVDSDTKLCNNWFEKAKAFITPKVGAVWGIEVWSVIQNPRVLKVFLQITRKIFETRGGTHDLLVRRDAIRDIRIPENLHVFEDAYIREWIIKKGYKVIPCYDPYCIHYRPQIVWTVKESIKILSDAIKCDFFSRIPKLLLPYGFYFAYFVCQNLSSRLRK